MAVVELARRRWNLQQRGLGGATSEVLALLVLVLVAAGRVREDELPLPHGAWRWCDPAAAGDGQLRATAGPPARG